MATLMFGRNMFSQTLHADQRDRCLAVEQTRHERIKKLSERSVI